MAFAHDNVRNANGGFSVARIYWNSGYSGREYSSFILTPRYGAEGVVLGMSNNDDIILDVAQVDDLIEQLSAIRGKATKPAEPPMIEGDDYR